MAGSYRHIVTDTGNLISTEAFPNMIENLGDAYEAIEEMYGMIWYLATLGSPDDEVATKRVVTAHQNYKTGLLEAKANKAKRKMMWD